MPWAIHQHLHWFLGMCLYSHFIPMRDRTCSIRPLATSPSSLVVSLSIWEHFCITSIALSLLDSNFSWKACRHKTKQYKQHCPQLLTAISITITYVNLYAGWFGWNLGRYWQKKQVYCNSFEWWDELYMTLNFVELIKLCSKLMRDANTHNASD